MSDKTKSFSAKNIVIAAAVAAVMTACASNPVKSRTDGQPKTEGHPVYVSKMPLGKYTLFAAGGWDGNWYVGSNQAWIEKINLAGYDKTGFVRAYLGAKLGRMKTSPRAGKPAWVRDSYPGEIYIAASATSSWRPSDYLLLTKTADIPHQYDYENAIETVGEAVWFWAEVPLDRLNFGGDNFAILWSPNEYFDSVSSAPILAAAWGDRRTDSWINTAIGIWPHLYKGDALSTPISVFEPAIALKLVPRAEASEPRVFIISVEETPAAPTPAQKITVAADGDFPVENVWLEISSDARNFRKIPGFARVPPHILVLETDEIPLKTKSYFLRAGAVDIRGERGYSAPLEIRANK